MHHRYLAALKGKDQFQYANNTNTNLHDQSTRTYYINGNFNDNGSSRHNQPLLTYKEPWNKRHKWMFAGACIAIVTAVVVLCVLLSRKHSSGAVHPSATSAVFTASQSAPATTINFPQSNSPTATPPTQSTLPTATPHSTKPSSSSPYPTLPPELRYLHDGAACTADSQCRPPNHCQTASDTNSVNNEVYTTTTCCAPTQWGCPGWECKDYNDCLDPWKCAGTGSKKTCCGTGAPYTGTGC
ncbi:uncharacterized protein CC84DRAFT_1221667 [Paraphaeosphaeria sporulosa]|uniref:Uncharacterized protein n=1 Tax=Paraphaeosphaeria sporulosa TaxID=1460663 RepID=A0A177C2Y8_9PLEO|nr:uncharacterized protein CC84DRAFT_1221667 [Paraphaeosphaeria sporulosa]OAG01137.1 hypothetical protein CC84DRAFT_1221667 [Paraphaeosphaeria sporulosa]